MNQNQENEDNDSASDYQPSFDVTLRYVILSYILFKSICLFWLCSITVVYKNIVKFQQFYGSWDTVLEKHYIRWNKINVKILTPARVSTGPPPGDNVLQPQIFRISDAYFYPFWPALYFR